MLEEILRYLSERGLAICFAVSLLYLIFDHKAIERLRGKAGKTLMIIAISGFFVILIWDVIRVILSYS